ncbi:hypothetical protein E2C01_099231 [Portunus trituberculatus]|uniref:Uncharacterized protein n=1 Tax=Portunus trituberculatus TaxID=210409 RepID=A0A5B7K926_PORTR|nr:hypothetical protein [Portunus trituberculatus]
MNHCSSHPSTNSHPRVSRCKTPSPPPSCKGRAGQGRTPPRPVYDVTTSPYPLPLSLRHVWPLPSRLLQRVTLRLAHLLPRPLPLLPPVGLRLPGLQRSAAGSLLHRRLQKVLLTSNLPSLPAPGYWLAVLEGGIS